MNTSKFQFPIKHRKLGTILVTVDWLDFPRVYGERWHLFRRRKVYYVRAKSGVLLHRFITSAPEEMTVDHIDGNPLNNARDNLLVCTNQENVKAGWERGAYAALLSEVPHRNVVRKRLADGSIRTYEYDRREHKSRAA